MNLPFAPSSAEKEKLYKSWENKGWHFTKKDRGPNGEIRLRGIESAEDVANLLFIVSQSPEVRETPRHAEIPGNGSLDQRYGYFPGEKDFLKTLRTYHADDLRTAVTGLLAGLSDPASPLSFQEKSDLFFYLCITPGVGRLDIGRPFVDSMLRYAATMDPATVGPDRAAHRAACTGMLLCLKNAHITSVMYAKENKPALLPVYADLPAKAVEGALALVDTLVPDDERLPDEVWRILDANASDAQIGAHANALTAAYTHRLKAEWDSVMAKHVKRHEREVFYREQGLSNRADIEPYDQLVSEESTTLANIVHSAKTQAEREDRARKWKPLHEVWNINHAYPRAVPGGSANIPAVDLNQVCPQIVKLRRDVLLSRGF